MAYIEWSEKFSVKVKEIDDQHKKLFEIINKLHDNLFNLETQKVVIEELVTYVTTHFETEEKYMMQLKFPGYEEHKKVHEHLTKKTMNIKLTFEHTKGLLSLAILNFLKEWLEQHVLNMDKKYAQFSDEKGLDKVR